MKPYDEKNIQSIYNYAKKLEDRSFRDAILMGQLNLETHLGIVMEEQSGYLEDVNAKGSSGHLLEKFYFGYNLNSSTEPDFKEAGLELKVTPLKINKDMSYSSKERMVLTVINFNNVLEENFETSHLMAKAQKILMIFYVHSQDVSKLDYKISNVYYYEIPNEDLPVIKEDWIKIQTKIKSGKAHELSEGDTLYLGACTKGANRNSVRVQPNSDILAMQRAFSFKNSYVNYIYKNYVLNHKDKYDDLIKDLNVLEKTTFETYVEKKISNHVGKTQEELCSEFHLMFDAKSKSIFSQLAFRMLDIKSNNSKEFVKANIVVKTIRVNHNKGIKESMSFPAFKFMDIIDQVWEESDFYNILSQTKFLFVVYSINTQGQYVLRGSQFWNMPFQDYDVDVRSVWNLTKETIVNGVVIKEVNGRLENNLPKIKDNRVSHVRPHAANRDDVYPLPDGRTMTKQAFWLNTRYIISQLDKKFFEE